MILSQDLNFQGSNFMLISDWDIFLEISISLRYPLEHQEVKGIHCVWISGCIIMDLGKKTQKLLFYGGAGEMFHENQFDQENMFYNALFCWIAIPIDLNSPFTGLYYTEKRLWYQQFLLRQLSVFRGGSPIVEFDATVMYRLYVTTMKEMNIQEDFPLLPIDNFKHHHMVALDLTSKQDVVEILQNLENKLENHWDWS